MPQSIFLHALSQLQIRVVLNISAVASSELLQQIASEPSAVVAATGGVAVHHRVLQRITLEEHPDNTDVADA